MPSDAYFFDNVEIKPHHIKLYNNATLSGVDERLNRVVSTNRQKYIRYRAAEDKEFIL